MTVLYVSVTGRSLPMSIVAPDAPKGSRVRFAQPVWSDDDPRLLDIEQRLPADHLARQIAQTVDRLDLAKLRAAYRGSGDDPYPGLSS
jgi:hypothetical protein